MSKKQIKTCAGFEAPVCRSCKRKDTTSYRLVTELSINEATGFRYCEHVLN